MRATDGPGNEVRFAHDGGRLVSLSRASGTSVSLEWDGDRIGAAHGSDGRTVSYAYDADRNLVIAHASGGARHYDLAEGGRVRSITDADGVVEVLNGYDAEGRVLEQRSPFGRTTIYGYLPGHVTVTADEQDGPPNTYIHDPQGRLLAIVDGDDQQMSFNYDARGNPVAITERNGAVTLQEWDDESHLLRRVLPGGAEFEFRYDDDGRVIEVRAATGETTAYAYQEDERSPVEVIDPDGGLTKLTVRDGLVREIVDPDGVRVAFEFDADGNVVAVVDADGNVARLERDGAGRVLAAVSPLGRRTTYHYDARGLLAERREPDGAVWRHDYTAAGRLAGVTGPLGGREEISYGASGQPELTVDALGRPTARRYDIFGNLERLVAADGATWQLTHDALSRPIATTDPLGAIWQREYDVNGNQVAAIDPAGTRCSATYDLAGRVTALSDGLTSSAFAFDQLGRTVAHRRPDGSELRAEHDRCGRAVALTDPTGGTTRIRYSPAGRVLSVTSPSGAVETYEYDRCGRCAARTDGEGRRHESHYDADGALVEQLDPSGEAERYVYDEAGRLAQHSAPGEGVTSYAYDAAGRIVEIADRAAGRRRFAYDAAGQLVGATDANGHTTRYGYNERGWLTEIVDPLGGVTARSYDLVGRMTSETDPVGRTTTLRYDAAGRLVDEIDASGRHTVWTYDVSGRVSTYGPAGAAPITITHDELGRESMIREPGSFTHELRWDREGRLVERRRDDRVMTWGYDADGNRSALGYPDGTRTTYRHDRGGYLVGLEHTAIGEIALDRDPAGRLVGATGAGMRARWAYDRGDLVRYELEAGGTERSAQFERDAVGRVVAGLVDGEGRRFAYDAAGQLLSAATPAGVFEFAYDAGGRLERESSPECVVAYEHDSASQLLVRRPDAAPPTTYEYDGAGRRVLEQRDDLSRRYRWDALGRLTSVETDEAATTVAVDALGELASVDGTPLMWDTADPMTPLTWMGDQAVVGLGSPWATAGAGATAWLAPDWQGTVGAGRDPWGAPAATAGPQLGFHGEVEIHGDVWLRNRVYQPGTRSFLQPDPLDNLPGGAGAANPYHYAANNPIGATDPLGLHPVSDAELQKYRDRMNQTIWDKAGDFVSDNWEYIAAGALVVAGGALMITGVGGPAGIALMSAGISVGMQKATTGHVDLLHVGIDVAIGLGTAGLGALAGPAIRTAAGPLVRAVSGPLRSVAARAAAALNPSQLASRLMNTGAGRAVSGFLGSGSRTVASRLPQDVAVSPIAPRALPLNRAIGQSPTQNAHLQQRILDLQAKGATDLRVNQQQVNLLGERVGINRPDLQYTQGGKRIYEEFDVPASTRGPAHEVRLRANDPTGDVHLFVVP